MPYGASAIMFFGFQITEDYESIHPITPDADNWMDHIRGLSGPLGEKLDTVPIDGEDTEVVAVKRTVLWARGELEQFTPTTINAEDTQILEDAVVELGLKREGVQFGWYLGSYYG